MPEITLKLKSMKNAWVVVPTVVGNVVPNTDIVYQVRIRDSSF